MNSALLPQYILITAARDEAQTLPQTMSAVAAQTHPPARWIVVNDGSTDATADLISRGATRFPFIRGYDRQGASVRSFSSKSLALSEGLKFAGEIQHEYIGFLDADITMQPDFFAVLLARLNQEPRQGLGGGAIFERAGDDWVMVKSSYGMSVAGGLQVFRRACYEDIGGYLPLPLGGIDMVAETMARMKGWTVKSFTDLAVYHHQPMGRTHGRWARALFRRGRMEYVNGYHPLFQAARFFSWLPRRPWVLASLIRSAGYGWAMLRREPWAVPPPVVHYLREEQLGRLKRPFGQVR